MGVLLSLSAMKRTKPAPSWVAVFLKLASFATLSDSLTDLDGLGDQLASGFMNPSALRSSIASLSNAGLRAKLGH